MHQDLPKRLASNLKTQDLVAFPKFVPKGPKLPASKLLRKNWIQTCKEQEPSNFLKLTMRDVHTSKVSLYSLCLNGIICGKKIITNSVKGNHPNYQ